MPPALSAAFLAVSMWLWLECRHVHLKPQKKANSNPLTEDTVVMSSQRQSPQPSTLHIPASVLSDCTTQKGCLPLWSEFLETQRIGGHRKSRRQLLGVQKAVAGGSEGGRRRFKRRSLSVQKAVAGGSKRSRRRFKGAVAGGSKRSRRGSKKQSPGFKIVPILPVVHIVRPKNRLQNAVGEPWTAAVQLEVPAVVVQTPSVPVQPPSGGHNGTGRQLRRTIGQDG